MSNSIQVAHAVLYRFDKDPNDPLYRFDQNVMFSLGIERSEGEHMNRLCGVHKPYDDQATEVLRHRLGVDDGVWTKVLSIEGSTTALERLIFEVEGHLFEQHPASEDVHSTLDIAERYFATHRESKEVRQHEVPSTWVLNEDDVCLLHMVRPTDVEMSGGTPWKELVTLVVKSKVEDAVQRH